MAPEGARQRTFRGPGGPTRHYDLFAGLRDDGVACLVTGAVALVLHGVPRLTPDIDLVVDPAPENVSRLERLLSSWGYGESGLPETETGSSRLRRFRHPVSALSEVDVVLPPPGAFPLLRAGATVATLVDVDIPFVGAADLLAIRERVGTAAGREDAAGLLALGLIRDGGQVDETDTAGEQIRKFSRWSVAARLDWLLAAARLRKGLSPEARPMTRGLVRRRGWYGGARRRDPPG